MMSTGAIHGGTARTALVTGASAGIGRAAARRLLRDGMDVVAVDNDAAGLDALASEISATGARLFPYTADLQEGGQILDVFGRIATDGHVIDVLVNNVGRSARAQASSFRQTDLATLAPLLAINLQCAIIASRQVINGMCEREWGRIINITSEAAFTGGATCWDYGAAKAGLVGFTRSIAGEVARYGVTANAIGPGLIKTAAYDQIQPELRDSALARIPAGDAGLPEDIANVAAFFASVDSRYVTGQTLLVNGGSWYL